VRGPSTTTAPGDVELAITISRPRPNDVPLEVGVGLPDGASLVAGLARETITDRTSTEIVRLLRIHLDRLPASDLIVTVDLRGVAFGAHATAAYRFGRPEPKLTTQTSGPGMHTPAGKPLGAPIPLK
jgi:hypothetical protein